MKKSVLTTLLISFICFGKNTVSLPKLNDNEINVLKSGFFDVVQNWSQEPTGHSRKVHVKVPENKQKKHPIAIVLHGAGGSADRFINRFNFLNNHIILAPQGYLKRWNIAKEKSKAPDISFIAEIISYLKVFKNVDLENISIIGSSNGSALVNQLLIEFDEKSFKKAVCIVSQLNEFQYRENKFWTQSANNSFDISAVPMNGRKILCLAGSEDKVANYYGGEGVLGYVFLNAQKSAYVFAKAMGYKGTEIPDELALENPKNFFKYSYLNGQVVHYKLQGAGHGFREMNEDANQIIKDFLETD